MTTLVCVYSCKSCVIGIMSPKCSDLCHHRRSHRRNRLLSVDFDNLCRQPGENQHVDSTRSLVAQVVDVDSIVD